MVIITDLGQYKNLHKMVKIQHVFTKLYIAFFMLFFTIKNPKMLDLLMLKRT